CVSQLHLPYWTYSRRRRVVFLFVELYCSLSGAFALSPYSRDKFRRNVEMPSNLRVKIVGGRLLIRLV
ncbi:MAG: hypothetical protein PHR79_09450, partial [Bacteroidales bacterium]|nr:hypothetical protein [Bacteroidales bacterium]